MMRPPFGTRALWRSVRRGGLGRTPAVPDQTMRPRISWPNAERPPRGAALALPKPALIEAVVEAEEKREKPDDLKAWASVTEPPAPASCWYDTRGGRNHGIITTEEQS